MKIKRKLFSLLITTALFIGMIPQYSPQVVEATSTALPNVYVYAEKNKDELEGITGKSFDEGSLVEIVKHTNFSQDLQIWHYSGAKGYWLDNLDHPKIKPIYDSDFKVTDGKVADLKSVLSINTMTREYRINKGTPLYTAIKNGDTVLAVLSSGRPDIKLTSLYDLPLVEDKITKEKNIATNEDGTIKGSSAKIVVNNDGSYSIQVEVTPKLNYYPEADLSYRLEPYDIDVAKYIPFVQNNFGYQVYSIFDKKGNHLGMATGWVYQKKPESMEGMPKGSLHPSMILNNKGDLKSGYNIVVSGEKPGTYNSKDIRIGDGTTFNTAGAVGQVYNFPINLSLFTIPKNIDYIGGAVVSSYVKLAEYKNGLPVYVKAVDSTISEAIYNDSGSLQIDSIKDVPNGIAQLNDVITSPVDLIENESNIPELSWVKELPSTDKNRLDLSPKSINQYLFGIRTKIGSDISTELSKKITIPSNADDDLSTEDLRKEFTQTMQNLKVTYKETDPVWTGSISYDDAQDFWDDLSKIMSDFQIALDRIDSPLWYYTYPEISNEVLVNVVKNQLFKVNNFDLEPFVAKMKQISDTSKVTIMQYSPTLDKAGVDTETTTVYLRYIVSPIFRQVNIIKNYKDGKLVNTQVATDDLIVEPYNDNGAIKYKGTPKAINNATLVSWGTSTAKPLLKEMPTNPIQSGLELKSIDSLSDYENVYIEWERESFTNPVSVSVPEWRLSKYTPQLEYNTATMSLSLTNDISSHITSTFSPEGTYSYSTVNPSGSKSNVRFSDYLHSKAITKGSYTISHSNPSVTVNITGNLNLVKSTDLTGIKLSKWLSDNTAETYDLDTGTKGNVYAGNTEIKKSDTLKYSIDNNNVYNHAYGVYYHPTCTNHKNPKDYHSYCACYLVPETPVPTYSPATYGINSTFDRYKAVSTDSKLYKLPSATKTESNGKTTVAKQEATTLNVYPEYAMLFEDDNGNESIKFAVGDMARKIQPITFNTMKYTVDFRATSTGTAQATAMAAKTTLASKGWGNIPVIYKGAGINNIIDARESKGSKDKGILTVKTYALDVGTNVNGENLKVAWGNSAYNTATIRDNLLAAFGSKDSSGKWVIKGTSTDKLQIDKLYPANTNNIMLTEKAGAARKTDYKLTVRGGILTEVNGIPVTSIKSSNPELYEALVGMRLIGANKDATVFKTYEHQAGAALIEQGFKTLAAKAKDIDNLSVGKGWYSEDSSNGVLIVTEYETVFELPISIGSGKIPMTVPGLATPVNKQLLFTQMLPGYIQINYSITSKDMGNGLGVVKSVVEHNTKADSAFGNKKVLYAVPNASTLDMLGY